MTHRTFTLFGLLAAALLLPSCARPQPGLWPPPPGASAVTVRVYQVGLHSLVELPGEGSADGNDRVVSWAYGERLWFFDANHPLREGAREVAARSSGALHAVFWPAGGVVEVTKTGDALLARDPGEVKRAWSLELSPAGLAAMRAWLARQRAPGPPLYDVAGQTYSTAVPRYWLGFTCHHFIADALWAAGVPIHSGWCILPEGLWWQLDAKAQTLAIPTPRP